MQLFYAPNITPPYYILPEQESKHCVRVLRMGEGDTLSLTDGRGTIYSARITDPNPKRCAVEVVETTTDYGKRSYGLTMGVAPTKNVERYEWFLEKATEVGIDRVIPLDCRHSERHTIKHERAESVITSAVKQSLKAYHPQLEQMTQLREVVQMPFDGVKLIAHCQSACLAKHPINQVLSRGDNVLIMIGPEGDFSPEEVAMAVANGFTEVSLGDARLRTETAAVAAAMFVSFINL